MKTGQAHDFNNQHDHNDNSSREGDQTWGRTNNESYIWEKDGHQEHHAGHRGKGPKGYKRSDSRISDDIHHRLTDDNFLDASEIEVTVMDSEVVLSGTVPERADKRRAEDIAESVSGVLNVENQIRIKRAEDNGTKSDEKKSSPQHHYKSLIHSGSASPKSIF